MYIHLRIMVFGRLYWYIGNWKRSTVIGYTVLFPVNFLTLMRRYTYAHLRTSTALWHQLKERCGRKCSWRNQRHDDEGNAIIISLLVFILLKWDTQKYTSKFYFWMRYEYCTAEVSKPLGRELRVILWPRFFIYILYWDIFSSLRWWFFGFFWFDTTAVQYNLNPLTSLAASTSPAGRTPASVLADAAASVVTPGVTRG